MSKNNFETMYATWLQTREDMSDINRSIDYGSHRRFFRYLASTGQLIYILKAYGNDLLDFLVKYNRMGYSVIGTYGYRMCALLDKRYKDVLVAIGNTYQLYLFFNQFKSLTKKHIDDIFDFYAYKNWGFEYFELAKTTRQLVEESFERVVNHYRSVKFGDEDDSRIIKESFENLLAHMPKKLLLDFRKELLLYFMDRKWRLFELLSLIPELQNECRDLIVEYCEKNNFYLSFDEDGMLAEGEEVKI